jgi:threonine dehydrogenase-like Zn-dependent dehydrogenase
MLAIQTNGTEPFVSDIFPQFSREDVWINVAYAGLCRTDVLAAKGKFPLSSHHKILGHECSGIVVHAPNGCDIAVGMRVTIHPLLRNGFVGIASDGAFAETIAVPPYAVIAIPDNLSLHLAAFTEPVAAALAIFNADIHPTDKILILGNGRIAELTHTLLRHRNYTHVNIASLPMINTDENGRKETNQFDCIIETNIHEQHAELVLEALKPKGLLVLKSRMHNHIHIPTHLMVHKELRIQGVHYGNFSEAIQLLRDGVIPTNHFGPVYSLSEFVEHFDTCEQHKIFCQPNPMLA